MSQRVMWEMSRTARWVRGHWPDRNPLRRATDRAEAVLIGVLAIAFLALAPGAAVLGGHWAAGPAVPRGARYQVRAVLTGNAPSPNRYSGVATFSAPARWTAPTGIARTGRVPVSAGARADGSVMVWVDRSGRLVRSTAEIADQRLIGELAAVFGVAALASIAGSLTHRILHRRRMAAWDADWRVTEPRWTSHR